MLQKIKCWGERKNCFAYQKGGCRVITDTREYEIYCPFFKKASEVDIDFPEDYDIKNIIKEMTKRVKE